MTEAELLLAAKFFAKATVGLAVVGLAGRLLAHIVERVFQHEEPK